MQQHSFDREWFLQRLSKKGKNQSDLARALGVDKSAVSLLLKGKRKMSAEEQDDIAAFLGVTIQEVATHRGGASLGFEEKEQAGSIGKDWEEAEGVPSGGDLRDPIFGCMKGTMTIPPDLDLTAPADPEWGKVYGDD